MISIRAVDDNGLYYDVDFFAEIDASRGAQTAPDADPARTALINGKTHGVSFRVNRQAAKQLDDCTFEIIATGTRLRRVLPPDRNKT